MLKFLSLALFLAIVNPSYQQEVHTKPRDHVEHTDFVVVHTGATPYNIKNNHSFYKFSTSFNSQYTMGTVNTLEECKQQCKVKSKCLGFAHYYDEYGGEHCNMLRNLGDTSTTEMNVTSYKKVLYYKNLEKHSIFGMYLDTFPNTSSVNHTIYLDLNYNGVYDLDEPLTYTNNNNTFKFHNLSIGNYLVREIQNDNCIQIIPGAHGYNTLYNGDGYADNVVEYYHDGHSETRYFSGGFIKDMETGEYEKRDHIQFLYALKDRHNLFISLYPEYKITFSFVDETIVDGTGNDIVIETFLNSTTQAHVSVSDNNVNYEYLGILNSTNKEFDLSDIGYDKHVAFISLHFFNNEETDKPPPLNIVSVKGVIESVSSPSYGVFINVPQTIDLFFLKDCHYEYDCQIYCIFGKANRDEMKSCSVGCDLWKRTKTCDCHNWKEKNVIFNGDSYLLDHCIDGCSYGINMDVFPDYTLKLDASGVHHHQLEKINCNKNPSMCFIDMLTSCNNNGNCSSLSFNETYSGLYNRFEYLKENNSIFLVKNTHLGDNELENFLFSTTTTSATSTTTITTSTTTSITSTTTSTTSTTTSITSTTTSATSTTTSTTSTTTSITSTTSTIILSKNSKSNSSKYSRNIYIVGITMVCIAVIICLVVLYKKNKQAIVGAWNNRDQISYSNPVYMTTTPQTTNDSILYQDIETVTSEDKMLRINAENINRYKLGLIPLSVCDLDDE